MPKDLFFTPHAVFERLTNFWQSKKFDEGTIIELSATCVVDMIKDAKFMLEFYGIGIEKVRGMVRLPCNLFRILDIYDENDTQLRGGNNGSHLYSLKDDYGQEPDDGDTIYLNYKGIPVNEDGIPLMAPWHFEACENFCKLKYFEEDYALGKIRPDTYQMWVQKMPGLITAARQNMRILTRKEIDDLNIIRYNMLVSIHNLPIKQKMYGANQ